MLSFIVYSGVPFTLSTSVDLDGIACGSAIGESDEIHVRLAGIEVSSSSTSEFGAILNVSSRDPLIFSLAISANEGSRLLPGTYPIEVSFGSDRTLYATGFVTVIATAETRYPAIACWNLSAQLSSGAATAQATATFTP